MSAAAEGGATAQAVAAAVRACWDLGMAPSATAKLVAAAARGAAQGLSPASTLPAASQPEESRGAGPITQLQLLLAGVECALGRDVGVSRLKDLLRGRGVPGAALAARVGKLSKIRNGTAHPDVMLVQEVLDCLAHIPPDAKDEKADVDLAVAEPGSEMDCCEYYSVDARAAATQTDPVLWASRLAS